jgi:hypothetical protein
MEIEFFCYDDDNNHFAKDINNDYFCCRFWDIEENIIIPVCSSSFSWNWFLYRRDEDDYSYASLDVVVVEDDEAACRPRDVWDPHDGDDLIAVFHNVWDGNQGTMSEYGATVKLKAGDMSDAYPVVPNCVW